MKNIISLILIFTFSYFSIFAQSTESSRLDQLNNYWSEVSRAVNEGDFEAYVNTCHTKGVLVEGVGKKAYPLSDALKRWIYEIRNTTIFCRI